MVLTPRHVAAVGALALVPIGIYAAASGQFTAVTAALAVSNLGLIVGSLLLMFEPESGPEHGAAH
ncbi:MAG: putative membrane protein [Natronomonas sp.]|jgi:uncharacterized membrane protein